jgi:hypothetical protein
MLRKSLWLIAIALACKAPPPKAPAGPPSIEGRITALQKSGDGIGRINVDAPTPSLDAPPANPGSFTKAAVRVTESTILIGPPPRPKATDFAALHEGLWVRVWFVGPVGQSYPVQANAGTIVIDSTSTPPL